MAEYFHSVIFLLLFYLGTSHGIPKLEKVALVIRHGERTPLFYGAIEDKITKLFLTNSGKLQGFGLGQWLRESYPNLLKNYYDQEEIYAQSSHVSRCIMTIQVVLAGLYYPLDPLDNWSGDFNINWTPIPVNTLRPSIDHILYPIRSESCPRLEEISHETLYYIEKTYPDSVPLINKNYDINPVRRAIASFYQLYYINPDGKKLFAEIMEYVSKNTDSNRLYTGMLLKNIVTEFNNGTRKMTLYGGHDSTILSLLYGMELTKPQRVTYLSTLIFEQYFDEEKWQRYIKILFLNDNKMTYLKLNDCEELCPREQFEKLINPLIPIDIEKECEPLDVEGDDSI